LKCRQSSLGLKCRQSSLGLKGRQSRIGPIWGLQTGWRRACLEQPLESSSRIMRLQEDWLLVLQPLQDKLGESC
ncbi:MAG: hypothetical protein ACOC3Y_04620, partial [Desulfohalobiaceae bacterium]